MEATIKIEIKPFLVPNFVLTTGRKGDTSSLGDAVDTTLPMSALDAETLERMCDDFRDSIFKKAGKSRPPQCIQER